MNIRTTLLKISRRRSLQLSVAAIALAVSGCGRSPEAPRTTEVIREPVVEEPLHRSPPPNQTDAVLAEAMPASESQSSSALATSGKAISSLAQTISQAYEVAKSQGQTAATSARDWLMDDLNSTNRWEYKILSLAEGDPARLELELNELGRDGWQCFHAQPQAGSLLLFLQRHPSSISRNIPMSDLLKVLPYLGLGDR